MKRNARKAHHSQARKKKRPKRSASPPPSSTNLFTPQIGCYHSCMLPSTSYPGLTQEPPKAPAVKWTEIAATVISTLTLLVTVLKESANFPWLQYAGWPAVGAAVLVLVVMAWKKLISPWRRKRAALATARAKVKELPDFVRKFVGVVANDNYTDSILYCVRSIHALPDGQTFNGQELTDPGRFLRELSEALVERFSEKPRSLAEIKLVFSSFDKIMYQFRTMYTAWRKDLMIHWHQLGEYNQTALVKSSGLYIKFVDDYANYRKSKDNDAYGMGSLFLPVPDPLPGLSPKPPAAAAKPT